MSGKLKIYSAMFLAMMFWGFSFIWTKEVLETYRPITTIFFRLLLSAAVLIAVNPFFKQFQKIDSSDFKTFAALSFFQPFLYFIGENYGLLHVSSTVTSVIIATIPLFSPFAAYIFFRERIKIMNLFGIIVSIFGVVLVIVKDDFSISANSQGLLFLALAVFSAVIYTVIISKLSGKYNVYTIITTQNTLGVFWFVPVFFFVDYGHFTQVGFKSEAFVYILKLALFASTAAYLFFIYGIRHWGIVKSNLSANTIPVFTAVFAFFFLGERLTLLNIIGILVVFLGLMLTHYKEIKNLLVKNVALISDKKRN